ncbi:hypothetical protein J7T55_001606 [Diaporthe amygdali]|uniref:uncharacterized protein n=1 Tax=Phomopsis amygdali TaxID=1214568 RepID=UPI0022FE568B|nr:uncharacterized protein J7T55_001606 [Diaporthe amygdali]KAJ0115196.1 hypothetical protein J7T55_001606 [Diaporthe amygdali]
MLWKQSLVGIRNQVPSLEAQLPTHRPSRQAAVKRVMGLTRLHLLRFDWQIRLSFELQLQLLLLLLESLGLSANATVEFDDGVGACPLGHG